MTRITPQPTAPSSVLMLDASGVMPRARFHCPHCAHEWVYAPPIPRSIDCPACKTTISLGEAAGDFNRHFVLALSQHTRTAHGVTIVIDQEGEQR